MPDLSGTSSYIELVVWGVLGILVTGEVVWEWLKSRLARSK